MTKVHLAGLAACTIAISSLSVASNIEESASYLLNYKDQLSPIKKIKEVGELGYSVKDSDEFLKVTTSTTSTEVEASHPEDISAEGVVIGNKKLNKRFTDFTSEGELPVSFTRTYKTARYDTTSGLLGYFWTTNIENILVCTGQAKPDTFFCSLSNLIGDIPPFAV